MDGKWLVLAILRGEHRQIELLDLNTGKLTALTREATDHWNPSISPDGAQVVYHRTTPGIKLSNVELWGSPPGTNFKLLRLAGAFPAFSPDGSRLALVGDDFSRLDAMNIDGSNRKTVYTSRSRSLFSASWAHQSEQIAFAAGGVFQGAEARVDLMAVQSPTAAVCANLPRTPAITVFLRFPPTASDSSSGPGGEAQKICIS